MWEFWISKLVFQLNKMIPSNFTVFLKPGWTVSAWSMKMFKYRRDASASEHHLQCQGLFRGGQQVRGESQIWSKLFSSLVPHLIVLPTVAAIWIFSIVRFLRWVQFAFQKFTVHLRLQSFLGVVDPGPVRAIRADSLHASPGRPLVTYFSFYAVHSSSIGDLVTHSLHWGYFALIEVIMFGLISTQLSSDIWSCLPKLPLLPGISHHFTSFNISHPIPFISEP